LRPTGDPRATDPRWVRLSALPAGRRFRPCGLPRRGGHLPGRV